MAYTKTTWVNGSSPFLNATNLNNMETGIEAAHTTVEINTQTGTSYTLVLSDAGKVVQMDNASSNTLTIPQDSSVAFPIGTIIQVRQLGAGATSVAQGTGATLRPSSPQAPAGQYKSIVLHKIAPNEWVAE